MDANTLKHDILFATHDNARNVPLSPGITEVGKRFSVAEEILDLFGVRTQDPNVVMRSGNAFETRAAVPVRTLTNTSFFRASM